MDAADTLATVTVVAKGTGSGSPVHVYLPPVIVYDDRTKATVTVTAYPLYNTGLASKTIAAVTVSCPSRLTGFTSTGPDASDVVAAVTVTVNAPYPAYPGYREDLSGIWVARPQTTDFVVYESSKSGPIGAARTLMETGGYVYQAWKLGDQMVYYGQRSIMTGKYLINVAPVISRRTIHSLGILGKNAVCVDDIHEPKAHYFIDTARRLHILSHDGRDVKDYSNHFASLGTNVVLSYDPRLDVVRIADGTYGFTYSVKDKALGWGPVNITGCGVQGSSFYIVAPAAITTLPLSCKTDILDFDSRKEKIICELDFGAAVAQALYAGIDYRWNKAGSFYSTPWVKTDRFGRAFFDCAGVEFQIKWKLTTYAYMRLDHLPVTVKFE